MEIRPSFVADPGSQLLVLRDAVASGCPEAIVLAFETVARARGLAQLATGAGLTRARLMAALANPAQPDLEILMQAVETLLTRAASKASGRNAFAKNENR